MIIRNIRPILMAAVLCAAPAMAEKSAFKVTSASAIRDVSTVTIGAFTVGFIFQSVDNSAATGGVIAALGPTTKAKSELVGVTDEMMQAITDAAYDDFRSRISASGFALKDSTALFASDKVTKLKPVAMPYVTNVKLDPKKDSKGKAMFFKPTALPGLIMLAGDVTGTSVFSGFSALGSMGAHMALADHARASGESVVNIVYLIDFSQVKRPGAFSFSGVSVNSGMAVVPDCSRATIFTPTSKVAFLTVQTPVAVEGDFTTKSDETKGGELEAAANVAGGVAAAMGFGGLKFGKTKTFKFTAKPAYQDGAIKAASLANERLAGELAALRTGG